MSIHRRGIIRLVGRVEQEAMNEQQKQELADEWHRRFEQARRDTAPRVALSEVERLFVACATFSFFAGAETEHRVHKRRARKEDIPVFLEVTIQEMLRVLADAGVSLERLGTLEDLLRRGANPDH